jgi:hypothetical protein
MLNHRQIAMALAVTVLIVFSTFVPSAYAQLYNNPTNPGSHPIIHAFIGPAVRIVGQIIGIVKAYAILHGLQHVIDRP